MININKKYQTRNGQKVRIYVTDGGGEYPVHGAAWKNNKWYLHTWTESGKYEFISEPSDLDLIEVPIYEWQWITQKPNGDFWISNHYYTEEEAAQYFTNGQIFEKYEPSAREKK